MSCRVALPANYRYWMEGIGMLPGQRTGPPHARRIQLQRHVPTGKRYTFLLKGMACEVGSLDSERRGFVPHPCCSNQKKI